MDIIPAIRELCKGDKGFENMFDQKKSGGRLAKLTGSDRDADLFEALLYGKPHGVGARNFYYEGKWTNLDECVWIDGVMCGYDYTKELEFGAFEDQKIGFGVNDSFVGNTRIIPTGEDEPFYDTFKKFEIK